MAERFCFERDDDAHYYIIPVDERENFETWLEDMSEYRESAFDFEKYRINTHFTSYSFENPREERG